MHQSFILTCINYHNNNSMSLKDVFWIFSGEHSVSIDYYLPPEQWQCHFSSRTLNELDLLAFSSASPQGMSSTSSENLHLLTTSKELKILIMHEFSSEVY